MIKYLKIKLVSAMVAITVIFILGFYFFFQDGNTFLLVLGVSSLIVHLALYYIFIKRPEKNNVQKAKQ